MASVTRNSDENTAKPDARTPAEGAADKPAKPVKGEAKENREAKGVEYSQPATPTAPRRRFFTIYKSGQGYWTRMGTLIGAGILGLMLSFTLYQQIPGFFTPDTAPLTREIDRLHTEIAEGQRGTDPAKKLSPAEVQAREQRIKGLNDEITSRTEAKRRLAQRVALGIALGFLTAYTVVALRLMNKPSNVDFLIATDSEMKKVNWTSRKELIGSTRVVIVFMFLIAALLFIIDAVFHLIFYAMGVLKVPPPWFPHSS